MTSRCRAYLLSAFASFTSFAAFTFPSTARAEGREVVLARTGHEPSCLRLDELTAAIRRDTGLAARASRSELDDGEPPGGQIMLRVTRESDAGPIDVRVKGQGLDVAHALAAPSCEATTDVVAAFVASTLAPVGTPPARAVSPSPETLREQLLSAVTGVLRKEGVDLEARGAALSFSIDADGVWTVHVSAGNPACTSAAHVGVVTRAGDELARSIANDVKRLLVSSSEGACEAQAVATPTSRRAELLAESLARYENGGNLLHKATGGLFAASGLLYGGLGFYFDRLPDASRAVYFGGAGLMTIGGIASYLVPDDEYRVTVMTSFMVGMGAILIGLDDVGASQRDRLFLPGTTTILGASMIALGGLVVHDAAVNPPVGNHRLARGYAKIDTREERAKISAEELARIEAEYLRLDAHTSPWLRATPGLAAGTALLALSIPKLGDDGQTGAPGSVIVGSILLGGAALGIALESHDFWTGTYRKRLRQNGLEVSISPAPGGIAIFGRF